MLPKKRVDRFHIIAMNFTPLSDASCVTWGHDLLNSKRSRSNAIMISPLPRKPTIILCYDRMRRQVYPVHT